MVWVVFFQGIFGNFRNIKLSSFFLGGEGVFGDGWSFQNNYGRFQDKYSGVDQGLIVQEGKIILRFKEEEFYVSFFVFLLYQFYLCYFYLRL